MNHHDVDLPSGFLAQKPDNQILQVALCLNKKGENVFFITKNVNLRIKAEILGLQAQNYETSKIKIDELYTGWREVKVSSDKIDKFYKDGRLVLEQQERFYPNEFIVLKDEAGSSKSALTKYSKKDNVLLQIFHQKAQPWGLKPLNTEQKFAIELLLCNNDDIQLVTLIGLSGAGKTILALACGLQKVVEEKVFRRLYIARPIIPILSLRDASSNGLSYLVERFRGQEIFGHITFSKSERSTLAALSSELL
ncbi:MAG: PhoH family protein [Endomicrobium sp.]|jgi:PhoH-like ATPase|nr:PhoH family protein [Endomicrobium sp.]